MQRNGCVSLKKKELGDRESIANVNDDGGAIFGRK